MYSPIRRNKEIRALSTENCLRQVQENRQIKQEGSKEEDRQEEADVFFFVKNGYSDLKRRHQNAKLGRFLNGQIVANTELQNKQDLPTICRSLLFVQPTQ